MTTMKTLALAAVTAALAGCATPDMDSAELDRKTVEMIKRDFHTRGIATADRVNQDDIQAACTKYGEQPPKEVMETHEKAQQAAIKYPADGKLMGDWKKGQRLAQSGRGMTWSDKAGAENGGNCYNCHQLSADELSFGTMGPSLLRFGKLRGNNAEMQRYVYGKIYNAKAFNLCSNMPRFGHFGILNEQQMRDLTAYVLDPNSPVNK